MTNVTEKIGEEVEKLLNKVCQLKGITNARFIVEKGAEKGDGYMGVINAAKIIADGDGDVLLTVIVKTASKNVEFRKQTYTPLIFFNETYCYDVIFPAFVEFQRQRGIDDQFANVAKCYATSTEVLNEGLVLENLRDFNYRVCDGTKTMDSKHVSLVLTRYAEFHAISFAMKDQQADRFEDLARKLYDVREKFTADAGEIFKLMCNKSKRYLDPIEDATAMERFNRFCENLLDYLEEIQSQNVHDHTVVIHGDGWTNNLMFRYSDDGNGKDPTNVRFLDWQMSKICTPVTDVAYFFYVCGSGEVISNHRYYINMYYDHLGAHIRSLGSDPDRVFSREVFEQHWKKYSRFGLLMALLMIPLMENQNEEVPDLVSIVDSGRHIIEALVCEPKGKECRKRLRNIILHFVNNNLI